ncbi:MAG TPA: DUF86 domain-containing protein [Tepidisphaeraceae bacterium]|jgi:uncharacterized protein with HEPN domain
MQPESRKLLQDMSEAAGDITAMTQSKSVDNYLASKELRWAVERGFEIIGEALSQLSKLDPDTAHCITEYRKIISFRNVLIHGYSHINDMRTWDIVQQDLPVLRRELAQLLSDSNSE